YHGASFGALSLGGDNRRWANEPGIPGIVRVFDPYCYRCTFGKSPDSCARECVSHIEEAILNEGPEYVAAIMCEGVSGTGGGLITPVDDYWPRLRALADKYNLLLISDEVMSGFGRTGQWFAVDNWNVKPDIITFAKGSTCGYVPLGGCIISRAMSDYFQDHMFWGGLTYSGHPLACATGIATLKVYEEEGLFENSRTMGARMKRKAEALMDKHPCIGDVRGIGLFVGVELVKNRQTREMLVPWNGPTQGVAAAVRARMMDLGVYCYGRWNMLFLAPPLVINEEEIDTGINALDEALKIADAAL
ncbi:MAG: aminotransferase class III-fold pyridoxal phosphate-dependent enzyme, partial [Chloroflexota bacterium]